MIIKLCNNIIRVCGILLLLLCLGCKKEKIVAITPQIIPVPFHQEIEDGVFILNEETTLRYDEGLQETAKYFSAFIQKGGGSSLQLRKNIEENSIILEKDETMVNEEAYRLFISKKNIKIQSSTEKGAFYAVQTLRQLLPECFENGSCTEKGFAIKAMTVLDAPRFSYRGMHLDVGRHFFSVSAIKKYIEMLAMLKMNTFHWHLTEDQGWRIEIKKYPKLTEIGAYRKETLVGHYNDQPHQFDGKRYGGFYTQEEIKEIVAFATSRNITVIPEIEMPGHSQAAIAAYPELGCSGTKVEVATKWGVFDEVYCPNQKTFAFLEDVLDEVVDLFPGKYIHIGGDEAPKTKWKSCNHCQQLIQEKELKDEHGLQSYFIARMEKYINSKGKQIIGWDEILEGGLAPNATVMFWRGTDGAVQAAKDGHDLILSPTSNCYFDYYQSDNENEPLAIGGFLPLEKVYSFNPIPEGMDATEEKHVLGAQGNVWTEYMPTYKQVEYMAFPRAIALSEVIWSTDKNKNYVDFVSRLANFQNRLDVLDVNYANHLYEIHGNLKNKNEQLLYSLETLMNDNTIRYTLDGSDPVGSSEVYDKPLSIQSDMNVKAGVFDNDKLLGNVFAQELNYHKAVGAEITLNVEPHKAYSAGGKKALINSISGNNTRFGDKEWLGFWGDDLEILIDLGKETEIHKVSTRFFEANGQWIYRPEGVKISLLNEDMENLFEKGLEQLFLKDTKLTTQVTQNYGGEKARYVKLDIRKYGLIPDGLQGAGNQAWTFIDEIVVE
ncbi:beta-N-acetylhexosaminidase [Aquimarina sp. 2201CG14-23]|uniref:beta-N-acetylhexosaminidase n=1 Tax=Aquimarina mycalae TaxID=3040073 RepID=UPI002477DD99|nr:family 20 glycosylhydrolase [Aquimarina sp. 2201CG14-23]MDH7444873.1 family 20 glycosylhydrolase [Aquimarina sp. 2201CG14-23]